MTSPAILAFSESVSVGEVDPGRHYHHAFT
jgi:hypothetical protein